jgi:hypothetical protein
MKTVVLSRSHSINQRQTAHSRPCNMLKTLVVDPGPDLDTRQVIPASWFTWIRPHVEIPTKIDSLAFMLKL